MHKIHYYHLKLNVLPEYKASPTLYVKGVLTLKEIPAARHNQNIFHSIINTIFEILGNFWLNGKRPQFRIYTVW